MIQFLCQKCDQNTKHPVVRDEGVVITVETASDKVMALLRSGKNSREISELTGLPLQNVNGLIIAEKLKTDQ